MGQTVFAKYHKGLKLSQAAKIFNDLLSKGATPINYSVHCEHSCTREELQFLFETGSISVIDTIVHQGIYSVADASGVWSCIKLISNPELMIIFTAGGSEIMYYSFL